MNPGLGLLFWLTGEGPMRFYGRTEDGKTCLFQSPWSGQMYWAEGTEWVRPLRFSTLMRFVRGCRRKGIHLG